MATVTEHTVQPTPRSHFLLRALVAAAGIASTVILLMLPFLEIDHHCGWYCKALPVAILVSLGGVLASFLVRRRSPSRELPVAWRLPLLMYRPPFLVAVAILVYYLIFGLIHLMQKS